MVTPNAMSRSSFSAKVMLFAMLLAGVDAKRTQGSVKLSSEETGSAEKGSTLLDGLELELELEGPADPTDCSRTNSICAKTKQACSEDPTNCKKAALICMKADKMCITILNQQVGLLKEGKLQAMDEKLLGDLTQVQIAVEKFVYPTCSSEKLGDILGDPSTTGSLINQLFTDLASTFGKLDGPVSDRYRDVLSKMTVGDFMADDCIAKSRIIARPDLKLGQMEVSSTCVEKPDDVRPTLITCSPAKFDSLDEWSDRWRKFILHTDHKCAGGAKPKGAYQFFDKQLPAKYAAEADPLCAKKGRPTEFATNNQAAIQMQVLYLYTSDAIFLKGAEMAKGTNPLKVRSLVCDRMIKDKQDNVAKVLAPYLRNKAADVLTLVETAKVGGEWPFYDKAAVERDYWVVSKEGDEAVNSLVLLSKDVFKLENNALISTEVSSEVEKIKAGLKYSDGELVLASATHRGKGMTNQKFVVGAYHAQSNGLESETIVQGVANVANKHGSLMVMGLDANTFHDGHKQKKPQADVQDFYGSLKGKKLQSCFTGVANTESTNKVRTVVGAQPAKGVKLADLEKEKKKLDHHPKDHIVSQVVAKAAGKQDKVFRRNSLVGDKMFKEEEFDADSFMPSFAFPSDHALIEAVLQQKDGSELKVVHWNVAGPQKNPFEFWLQKP